MSTSRERDGICRAFSTHRFEEVFADLADEVRWILPGQAIIEGSQAVIEACRGTGDELAETTTSWLRVVSAAGEDVVAVDVVGRYEDKDGVTAVSSCDIYEFDGSKIARITSYAVEVDPDDIG